MKKLIFIWEFRRNRYVEFSWKDCQSEKKHFEFQKFLEKLAQNKKIMLPLYKNIFESQEVYALVKIKSNNIVIKNGT